MSASVGQRLKATREAKKVDLEEACRITKIQRQTLEAIEEDRVQELLDPAYARIFVKKYALFLGLDAPSVVQEYYGSVRGPSAEAFPAPAVQGPKAPRPVSAPASAPAPSLNLLLPGLVALAALVGIGFLGYLAVDLVHNLRQPRPPSAMAPAAPAREKKERAPELLVPMGRPLRLTIQASADVWLQVKADGTVIFQNVLSKGSRESWTAKNDLELWTGNAGAMQMTLNGKPLEGLGRGVRKGVKVTHTGIHS